MKLNHKAVLLAVLTQQAFHFFWYHPKVLGALWMERYNWPHQGAVTSLAHGLIDRSLSSSLQASPFQGELALVTGVFASISFCYLLAWMFQVAVIEDWQRGLTLGLMVGVGFLAPQLAMHYTYLKIDAVITLIDCARDILAAGIAGAFLGNYKAERTVESQSS